PVTVDLIRLERFEDRVHLLRLRGVCGRDVTFDKSRRIGSRPERAEATDHYEPCAHFVSLPTDLQIERPEPSGVVSTGRHGNDHHIRTGEIGKVGVDVGLDVFDPIERDRRTTAAHCDHFMPATGGFGDDGRTGVTGATDDDDLHVPVLVLGTWYLGIGTSPPWSGSGTGEHRRRRGGGASEASQETTVVSLRSYGPRPLGTSCHSPTPLTASWGRNPRLQRNGAFQWLSAECRQVFDVVEADLTLGDELPVVLTCDLATPRLTRSAPVDGRGHRHEDARGGRPEEVGGVGDADGTRHSLGHRPDGSAGGGDRLGQGAVDAAVYDSVGLVVVLRDRQTPGGAVGLRLGELDTGVADEGGAILERVLHSGTAPGLTLSHEAEIIVDVLPDFHPRAFAVPAGHADLHPAVAAAATPAPRGARPGRVPT